MMQGSDKGSMDAEIRAAAERTRERIVEVFSGTRGFCSEACELISSELCDMGVAHNIVKGCVEAKGHPSIHYWLELLDGRALDVTGDQFDDGFPQVYLGPRPEGYHVLTTTRQHIETAKVRGGGSRGEGYRCPNKRCRVDLSQVGAAIHTYVKPQVCALVHIEAGQEPGTEPCVVFDTGLILNQADSVTLQCPRCFEEFDLGDLEQREERGVA